MGEGDSVREMLGTEMGPEGGVPPCSQTQGAPMQVAGEVESVAQNLEKIKKDKLKHMPPKILQELLFCDSFILDPSFVSMHQRHFVHA